MKAATEAPADPLCLPLAQARPAAERVITTQELLAGAQRIWIQHASARYLLQVTRSGKLILTK